MKTIFTICATLTVAFILFQTSIHGQAPPTCVEVDPNLPNCVNRTGLGTITPPQGLVKDVGTDPSVFVASLIRNGISLLVIASFVIAVIWTIINGLRFILANGDEKTISSAWTQIYWTLIGMVIILSSFAIIKLIETFFGVHIFDIPFQLPKP